MAKKVEKKVVVETTAEPEKKVKAVKVLDIDALKQALKTELENLTAAMVSARAAFDAAMAMGAEVEARGYSILDTAERYADPIKEMTEQVKAATDKLTF